MIWRVDRVGSRAHPTLSCKAACLLALLAAFAAPVAAEQTEQDLYLKALQSIAEGRRNDASAELARLIEKEPMHAGAWLELALTQCSLGHADEAERIFATIETRFNPSRAILELIANAREEGCANWQPMAATAVTLSRGFDRNVNQGAATARHLLDTPTGPLEVELSDDFTPRRDSYTQLAGEHTRELTRNGTLGFLQYQTRRNDTLHQYDTGSLYAGVETPYRVGRWSMRGTAGFGAVTLGGRLYQRQGQLQGRVTVPLPLPKPMQFNLLTGLTWYQFPTLTNFDSVTGELRGQLSWRESDRSISASLGYLDDRARAQRPGGDRTGVFGNVLLRKRVTGKVNTELAYTFQAWHSELPYSPGLIDKVRDLSTHVLRANLTYAINRNHSLQLEGRIVRNRENISIFQYNNRQLQLSWQWQTP